MIYLTGRTVYWLNTYVPPEKLCVALEVKRAGKFRTRSEYNEESWMVMYVPLKVQTGRETTAEGTRDGSR